MSFLDRLLGRRPDPTVDWPQVDAPSPQFDLAEMRLGTLKFGDPLEAARFLGRPDSFHWVEGDKQYGVLTYARHGFAIDFEAGQFCYLAFFIGPDLFNPDHPGLNYAQLCPRDGVRLDRNTNRAQLLKWFGAPESEDKDEDETILYYPLGSVTMELELNPEPVSNLKRWNLYPESADA